MQKVAIGIQDFETIRNRNVFYVDKTHFISAWWEKNDDVTLITRPRRFGKTLMMSMVAEFFSTRYANRGDMFDGLEIWETEKYHAIQGTYPVIFLTFANVKETTYESARKKINQVLTEIYNKNDFLLESGVLNDLEREYYKRVTWDMDETVATSAIRHMCDYLCRCYGKKVIVLLDEYDTPIQEAYVDGYWQDMTALIRSMLNATFKTNPYLERALMTGITRVSKESIFSDLNNLNVVTTTSDEYSDCFGFTEDEVFSAMDEMGLSDSKQQVKEWYDGFTFGSRTDIYNPWSIINFLDKGKLDSYWANTSSNSLIGKLIRESDADIKVKFETLLGGGTILTAMDEQVVYNQLSERQDAIWSLLLASGYLKAEKSEFIENRGQTMYELRLTNKEVRFMFENMVSGWFARCQGSYNDFIKALLRDDVEAMNAYMNRVTAETFSFFDSGTRPSEQTEPERFYHGFVLGLLVDLNGRYVLTSNRESGFGRYDVMMEPIEQNDMAYILEFKVFNPAKEHTLEDTVASAKKQIDDMCYGKALTARGIPESNIRKYGFAFEGKKVLIG